MQRQLCSFEKLEIVAFYIYLKSSQCEIQTAGKMQTVYCREGEKVLGCGRTYSNYYIAQKFLHTLKIKMRQVKTISQPTVCFTAKYKANMKQSWFLL